MRRNILLITVDQWRGDCLGSLGHPVVRTPNLDRLAEHGVTFTKHFAQCAPCGPSRASLHTGLYMHAHRSIDNGVPLDARFTNMALEARAAGYDPTLYGYTDTTLDPRALPAGDAALSTYESVLPGYALGMNLITEATQWLEWLGELGYDISVGLNNVHHPDGGRFGPPAYSADHTDSAFLTNHVLDHLASADPGWFVHASYLRPHPPFVVPEPYNSMFDPADMPSPVRRESIDDELAVHGLLRGFAASGQTVDADPDIVARWRAVYFAMMVEVDAQLGRLFDAVDLSDTTVIVTSDHGEQLGDHWLTGKLGFYPESFHIPLIVAGAGVGNDALGSQVVRFTENIDLFPTVMDIIGAPTPTQGQGASLVPFLLGEEPSEWRDAAHWEWDFRTFRHPGSDPERSNLAVLHDDHGTYVHFAGGRPLFFDLDEDPHHFVDASTIPASTATVLDYAQRLLTWRLRTDHGDLVDINTIA